MTNRTIAHGVIPPEAAAAFAARLGEVLEIAAQPYDCRHPVRGMAEQPIPLWGETRPPIAGPKKHPRRVDSEYARAGTACLSVFCEPLLG